MVSVLNSSTGLSATNIAALFGTTPASSDPDAKDGAKTSAGAASATPITGFGAGTNAAKAIQAIVTQIQMEKIQTKSSSLSFASVSTTYGVQVQAPSGTGFVGLNMTAVDRTASATASDTAGAIGALLDQVNGRAAQIESDQGGALVTEDEYRLGRGGYSTLLNWTANSATITTKGFSSDGIMTQTEQDMLGYVLNTSLSAQQSQTPASQGAAGATSSSQNISGTALYLDISIGDDVDFSKLEAQEQQLVSAFKDGTLSGHDGTPPGNGAGFAFLSETGVYGGIYSIQGTVKSNIDPSVATKDSYMTNAVDYFNHQNSEFAQSVALGGTVVGVQYYQQHLIGLKIAIPLDRS